MKTSDFDFDLPESFIAQNPVIPRDSSKMLFFNCATSTVSHGLFADIENYLGDTDCMLLNSSKVVPARIEFRLGDKDPEIFVLKNLGDGRYKCLVRPGKLFQIGAQLTVASGVECEVLSIFEDGSREINFGAEIDLDTLGKSPLPPYIKNSSANHDQYQTVYSDLRGSVAAPTAGLHFTNSLLSKLEASGVQIEKAALHVGRGTFLPVSSNNLLDHKMHEEDYFLNEETANSLSTAKADGKRTVAVGTTSVRILESSFNEDSGKFVPGDSSTDLFIYPGGYKWKTVDALITNFHLPKSTLLMLVASFLESKGVENGKDKILELYEIAKLENYRFYSFGDSMFIY
jgi:S-adenosylmethionine:tRNA ribosyltransferase-isomerase